jgi:NAD(P)-dependent dehydrogenase (short-subunit alcohol dehydrogenase family)
MMAELDGMLALVAGATRPHGPACAAALRRAGARLALVSDEGEGAGSLNLDGAESYALPTEAGSIEATLDLIEQRQGPVGLLVTCPAPPIVAASASLPADEVERAFRASQMRAFMWCQAVGRRMIAAGRGAIVNVTGLSGMGGWPGWLAQSMTLGAIHNLTHTLATEWTRYGVRVNCLVPGITERDLPDLLKTPEAPDGETVLRRIPVGRLATDEDLGNALIYLLRPEASFISGEILRVDGAWDVWGRYYAVDPHAGKR